MRIIIVGAGAIGGTLAAELALAGAEVVVVARGAHGEAISERGLHYRTPHASRLVPLHVVADIALLDVLPGDVAILATKLADTKDAAQALSQRSSRIPTLCLQNGVAGESMAAAHLAHVYGGMIYLPSTYLETGCVDNYCSNGPGALRIGPFQGGAQEGCESLATALQKAGFNAALVEEILPWKYGKLLTNLGNALELAASDWHNARPLYQGALGEGQACLEAAGITYIPVDTLVDVAAVELAAIDGKERPGGSMWQSVARQRSPEVDYLNGLIVKLGEEHGIPTPINTMLVKVAWQSANQGTRWTCEELHALAN